MADTDTNAMFLDDFDPSISYIGTGWYVGGTPALEYNGTTHATSTGGSKFSVSFNGTSISVFGTLAANVSGILCSSYTFNDEPKAFFNAPPNQTSIVYHTLFYASPIVPYGTHTLVVTMEDIEPENNYYLDYLSYTPATPNATENSASSPASLTTTTSLSESAAASATTNGPSIGVVIPAIIVPICGTLLLLLLCVWWLLRRRSVDWERAMSEIVDTRSERSDSLLFGHIKPYPTPYAGSRSDGGSNHAGSIRRSNTGGTQGPDYEASIYDLYSPAHCEPATNNGPFALPRTPRRAYQGGTGRSVRGRTGNTGSINNPDIPPAYASAY